SASSRTLPPPSSPLFPYTTLFRSLPDLSDLARSCHRIQYGDTGSHFLKKFIRDLSVYRNFIFLLMVVRCPHHPVNDISVVCHEQDRKSTRLNSSHVSISYAVFCLT